MKPRIKLMIKKLSLAHHGRGRWPLCYCWMLFVPETNRWHYVGRVAHLPVASALLLVDDVRRIAIEAHRP